MNAGSDSNVQATIPTTAGDLTHLFLWPSDEHIGITYGVQSTDFENSYPNLPHFPLLHDH